MIKQLTNIGGIKSDNKDVVFLAKLVQKEFDHLRQRINERLAKIPQQSSNQTQSQNVIIVTSSGNNNVPSGGTQQNQQEIRAGIYVVNSVGDTFVQFSSPFSSNYVLTAYFLDANGQFANLPIPQANWQLSGFNVSGSIIPSSGFIFYIAVGIN